MAPKVRARPRSAPPAPRVPANATSTHVTAPFLSDTHKKSLKRFEKLMKQLEASCEHTAKQLHKFVAALQETSKSLCDCVAASPQPCYSTEASAGRAGLDSLAHALHPSQETSALEPELALWDAQMHRLVTSARALSAATKDVRGRQKSLVSAARKSCQGKGKAPGTSRTSQERDTNALHSAEDTALAGQRTLDRLLNTTLQDMLHGFSSVVVIVAAKIGTLFEGENTMAHQGTQTDAPSTRVSRSTQTPVAPPRTADQHAASPSAPQRRTQRERTPDGDTSTAARSSSAPRLSRAPVAPTPTPDTVPVLHNITRAFESLVGLFTTTSSDAPVSSSELGSPHTGAQASAQPPSVPPGAPTPAGRDIQRGVVVGRLISSDGTEGRHTEGHQRDWLAERLPPPQYPEYLFSSGDLFSSVLLPHGASSQPVRDW